MDRNKKKEGTEGGRKERRKGQKDERRKTDKNKKKRGKSVIKNLQF